VPSYASKILDERKIILPNRAISSRRASDNFQIDHKSMRAAWSTVWPQRATQSSMFHQPRTEATKNTTKVLCSLADVVRAAQLGAHTPTAASRSDRDKNISQVLELGDGHRLRIR
jgi:hypothetical protein